MQKIELTASELEVLKELLEQGIKDIDVELVHTDSHDFKRLLKERRVLFEGILARFPEVVAAV